MRAIIYFSILSLLVVSCKPKDDTPSVVGTWKISWAAYWTGLGKPGMGMAQGDAWTSECQKQEKFIFSDKKLKKYSYTKQQDGSCLEDVMEASYSISEHTLSYSSLGKNESFEFKVWDNGTETRMLMVETLPDGKRIARYYVKQ
ncbi:lipocalin family protein [Capnocytophaga sp.]|uniref:lipocalin family protein n=1 Tax=Capnocytophaga sp. TaxID=44737 RepID=UPI0026DC6F36|nr:lipocalin family protein [Capnocytophaga sp.]MDO5106416.1 lipocalin family protein [Capnocytophaga sp.]